MTPSPQQGVLNRPPDHLLLVAANLTTPDPATSRAAIERLREIVHHELRSQLGTTPATGATPPLETGELGFDSGYDRYHLTTTVGFAATAYDKLGVTGAAAPADLRPIDWAALKDTPLVAGQADLIVQICTDAVYIAEHVVRRITTELADVIQIVWVLPGSQRHTTRAGRVSRNEARAVTGFLDGTSNLSPQTNDADRRLVFVNPADRGDLPPAQPDIPAGQPNPYGGTQPPAFPPDLHPVPGAEPDWTNEGTYMVVRATTLNIPSWDATDVPTQEADVGRRKVTGNPMDTNPDVAQQPIPEPNFGADPDGNTTRLAAHIRKANPRGPGDELRRIFRRGYPLILPTTNNLELGLAFICFARTITTQFEFITRGWIANDNFPRLGTGPDLFRQFESAVLAGGYFFVPPLAKASQPWSWVVPPAS